MTTELRHHAHVHKVHKFTRLLTGWLFPLNHQLLSLLKEKVLKGDAGDIILQVSRNKDCRMSDSWNVSEIIVFCEQNYHLFREMRSNMTDMEKRSNIHTFWNQKDLKAKYECRPSETLTAKDQLPLQNTTGNDLFLLRILFFLLRTSSSQLDILAVQFN